MKFIEQHPLGYTKVNLLSVFGYRARLHIWHTDTVEDAHNHRWNFVSIPLVGQFIDRRYVEGYPVAYAETSSQFPAGLQFEDKIECYPDRGDGRRYEPVESVPIRLATSSIRRPLRPWRCRVGSIHAIRPVGHGPHMSLVLLGRPKATSSDVWRKA